MKIHRSVKPVTLDKAHIRTGLSGALVPTSSEIKLNDLLAALPEAHIERWLPHLELVEMPLGAVLYESGKLESHAYFPTSGIVSLLYVMKNGDSAEIAVVGNEGMVGVALFMGGNTTTSRAVVQAAGLGYRLKASHLTEAFDLGGPLAKLLLGFHQRSFIYVGINTQ